MKLKDGYVIHKLGDEFVAINVKNPNQYGNMIRINETGAEILNLLKEDIEMDELVKKVCDLFEGTDEEVVRKDIEEFIQSIQMTIE